MFEALTQIKISFGLDPINNHVVDHAALLVEQKTVLRLRNLQARHIVGCQPLAKLQRPGAAHLDLAHVADIEQAGLSAHRHMLFDDAAILHRHFPAGELDHLGAGAPMGGVERSFFQRHNHRRDRPSMVLAFTLERIFRGL